MPFAPNVSDQRGQLISNAFDNISRFNERKEAAIGLLGEGIAKAGDSIAGGISGFNQDLAKSNNISGQISAYQAALPQIYGKEEGTKLVGALDSMLAKAGKNTDKQAGAVAAFGGLLQDYDSAYRQEKAILGYRENDRLKQISQAQQPQPSRKLNAQTVREDYAQFIQQGGDPQKGKEALRRSLGDWAVKVIDGPSNQGSLFNK